MKIIFLLLVTITICHCQPKDYRNAKILSFSNVLGEHGVYRYSFETSDGTIREESGTVKKVGNEDVLVVTGFYSYLDNNGGLVEVNYIADEFGFRTIPKRRPLLPEQPPEERPFVSTRIDPTILGTLAGGGVK